VPEPPHQPPRGRGLPRRIERRGGALDGPGAAGAPAHRRRPYQQRSGPDPRRQPEDGRDPPRPPDGKARGPRHRPAPPLPPADRPDLLRSGFRKGWVQAYPRLPGQTAAGVAVMSRQSSVVSPPPLTPGAQPSPLLERSGEGRPESLTPLSQAHRRPSSSSEAPERGRAPHEDKNKNGAYPWEEHTPFALSGRVPLLGEARRHRS